jgi:nucleoside-diphosphate-sugar epimerase
LLDAGHAVDIITRPGSDLSCLAPVRNRIQARVHDGTTEGMSRIVAESRPDLAIHLASLFIAEHKPSDVTSLVQSNILFATQLADALAANGVKYLLNTGTAWQHYEGRDYSPVCLYAATKHAFDAVLQYYVEALGLRVITLKLFDTYGPGDPRPKLFALLKRICQSGETLAMSPGEQRLDLLHVDDVVAAYLVAIERLLAGRVSGMESYAVSSGAPLSLRELVSLFETVTGKPLHVQWGGRPYRHREVMQPWSRGAKLPGWNPRISLAEGIRSDME